MDAALHIKSGPVLEWKKSGRPIVGYTCSYVPSEIFYAAGILPVRLRGIEAGGTDIADSYFGPFICSFPKCILQIAGKGGYDFLDGVVITPGCDSMRRIDECWRKAGQDIDGIVPSFFHYFDVPHKAEAHGLQWFMEEMKKLIKAVSLHFGVKIEEEGLRNAIRAYNRGRRLLARMEAMRSEDDVPVTGADAFAVTLAGSVMPRDEYTGLLESWVAGLTSGKNKGHFQKIRLMLAGSASDEISLFRMIEDNTNALVVSENFCFGIRSENDEADEQGDPMLSLARHYLQKSVCPRMYGKYRQRLIAMKNKIQQAKVDGVVMQNIRFCDLHGAENSLYERDLEAMGIPCLKLEREYGPMADSGRMKLRLTAFLERIAREKRLKPEN